MPALAAQADVLAIDLLGFGASDKPRSRLADEPNQPGAVLYCFDIWARQVADAAISLFGLSTATRSEVQALHLIGNSIGGMVALTAAHLLVREGFPPKQVVLIDCAQRTLDDKRASELPGLERLSRPLLKQLVRQRWVITPLFRLLAQPTFIRQVLQKAYPSGAHIDDELIALLHRPSSDPGATESFRGFVNLFNDYLAPELLVDLAIPVRLLWGAEDPWEDPKEAQRWANTFPCIEELQVLEGLGHCPHDEGPERVNPILLQWIDRPNPQG
jgi:pimeloyl-ACP methyl ester carboxylesterase